MHVELRRFVYVPRPSEMEQRGGFYRHPRKIIFKNQTKLNQRQQDGSIPIIAKRN